MVLIYICVYHCSRMSTIATLRLTMVYYTTPISSVILSLSEMLILDIMLNKDRRKTHFYNVLHLELIVRASYKYTQDFDTLVIQKIAATSKFIVI